MFEYARDIGASERHGFAIKKVFLALPTLRLIAKPVIGKPVGRQARGAGDIDGRSSR